MFKFSPPTQEELAERGVVEEKPAAPPKPAPAKPAKGKSK